MITRNCVSLRLNLFSTKVNELDDLWSAKLSDAIENARTSGRDDIADYLELKATNDSVRQVATDRLFQAFIELALNAENVQKNILVERESPHSFVHRNANMHGTLLRLARGVRCLTLEAGWTRGPSDGFMRLGALAFARITHFGMPEKGVELVLKPNNESALWITVKAGELAGLFEQADVERHIGIFLDDRIR
ncbi:MAG: hypothetical protein ACJ72Z_13395 [Pyrinomonadaceae bacterium]